MISRWSGDLLDSDAQALVNTVNTAGVMGKGLALQFKHAFPENFESYAAACSRGEVRLGEMFVVPLLEPSATRYVVNFPTKAHWRSKSKLIDVVTGLEALIDVLDDLHIESIAIPPLGCGLGGLQWSDVEPLIEQLLGPLDVDVRIYPPVS